MSVIKRVRLPPLDRDPRIKMLPPTFNLSGYNPIIKARVLMNSGEPQVHPINAR